MVINEDSLLFLYELGLQAALHQIPFLLLLLLLWVLVVLPSVFFFPPSFLFYTAPESATARRRLQARRCTKNAQKKQRHAVEIQSRSLILSAQPEGKILFFGGVWGGWCFRGTWGGGNREGVRCVCGGVAVAS